MKNYNESAEFSMIELNTWGDYIDTATGSKYKNWAFRRHTNADWPIYSSLSRYLHDFGVHQEAWAGQEDRILRIFKRKAPSSLENGTQVSR